MKTTLASGLIGGTPRTMCRTAAIGTPSMGRVSSGGRASGSLSDTLRFRSAGERWWRPRRRRHAVGEMLPAWLRPPLLPVVPVIGVHGGEQPQRLARVGGPTAITGREWL